MAPTLAHAGRASHRRSPTADTSRRVLWLDIAGAQRAPGRADLATLLSLLANPGSRSRDAKHCMLLSIADIVVRTEGRGDLSRHVGPNEKRKG